MLLFFSYFSMKTFIMILMYRKTVNTVWLKKQQQQNKQEKKKNQIKTTFSLSMVSVTETYLHLLLTSVYADSA